MEIYFFDLCSLCSFPWHAGPWKSESRAPLLTSSGGRGSQDGALLPRPHLRAIVMAPSRVRLPAQLFVYSRQKRLPAFQSGPARERLRGHAVFVPGLTDGPLSKSYVPALGAALERLGYSLVQPVLSSSYKGECSTSGLHSGRGAGPVAVRLAITIVGRGHCVVARGGTVSGFGGLRGLRGWRRHRAMPRPVG